jgi:hypothetical protein
MWRAFAAQARKLNEAASRVLDKLMKSQLGAYIPDKTFLLDMANYGLFPMFDFIDEVRAMPKYAQARRRIFWGGIGVVSAFIGYQLWNISTWMVLIENKDPRGVKKTAKMLEGVLDKFVFTNPFIITMLGNVLADYVFASDKITFTLARTLGRVISSDNIKNQLADLTKVQVLKESVLYSPEIYEMMRKLIIEQLRAEHTRVMVTELIANYMRSESAINLTSEHLSNVLRIDPVVNSFVKGVVNDNVYKMITNKELAKKLDNQLYEVLK